MAKIHLSRIKSSAFKISSYAGPSVVVRNLYFHRILRLNFYQRLKLFPINCEIVYGEEIGKPCLKFTEYTQ